MTDRNHTGSAPSGAAIRSKLFKLNAEYLIDPEAELSGIGVDIGCMSDALIATIQAIVDTTTGDDHQLDGLLFGALYQAKQVAGMSAEYVRRTASAPAAAQASATGPALPGRAEGCTDERQALSDASCANNAVRQALDAIQVAVYSDLGPVEQGMYEAAIASTERVQRALSRGLEPEVSQ